MKFERKEMMKRILLSAVLIVAMVFGYNQYNAYKEAQERKEMERILQSFNIEVKSPLEIIEKRHRDATCFERQAKVAKEQERQKMTKFIYEYALEFTNEHDAEQYSKWIMHYATLRDQDPLLTTAQVDLESDFRKGLIGTHKDAGALQILPRTGAEIAESLGEDYSYQKLFDIKTNIRYGTKYYEDMVVASRGAAKYSRHGAAYIGLVAYNRGPDRAIREFKNGKPVTVYADAVMSIYNKLKKQYKDYKME